MMTGLSPLLLQVAHQAAFGAIAAVGFGVLFNLGGRGLIWSCGMGALALAVRTVALSSGWSLEAATFVAALATATVVSISLYRRGSAADAIALVGCIPMVPGAFFGKALLGFFALTGPAAANPEVLMVSSSEAMLRVIFTLGAIGAGLAIPSHMTRHRGF
jgi:uncharacterized membrane protein YjjB (DUF3815 family)